jgi:uncharacterized protein involved in exopolysaccharide biosynthesis
MTTVPALPPRRTAIGKSRDLTTSDLIVLAWKRKGQLVACILGGFVFGAVISAVVPKKYEAHGSFIGVGGGALRLPAGLGPMAGLASQLGLSALAGGDVSGLSPYFFSDLLTADTILSQLATIPLPPSVADPASGRRLIGMLGVQGRSSTDSLEQAIRKLRRSVVVDLDLKSSVIKFTFTARSPTVAAFAADTLLGLVNGFVTRDLRTRAGAQRRFLQGRLDEAASEVARQEDRLRTFLEANRDYRNSPSLTLRAAELQRDLDLKRDIYLSVARSLEEARMNEVRDTPLLSVIDQPSVPSRPTSPRPILNAVLLALLMPLVWFAIELIRLSGVVPRIIESH